MTSSFDSYVRLQAEDVPYVSFIRYRRYTQVNFWLMLPRVFPEILQGSLQYTLPSYHFPKVYSLYLLDCLSSFCTHFLRRHIHNPWICMMPIGADLEFTYCLCGSVENSDCFLAGK